MRCYCLVLGLLFNLVMSTAAAEPETVDPSRFEVTTLVNGLKQPMELAIAPDGTIFLIELDGKLKSIAPRTHAVAVVGELKITTAQENGLIGLALDPGFPQNPWIYLQYSPPDYSGQHVSRFTLVDGKLDPASEKILFRFEEQRKECCHHAGSLHFGPDGCLFIATGDNTHPHGDSQGFAPIDERPERAPWDAQKSASNTHSANGKILRIRPRPDGTVEIPDGNLFPKDGSRGLPEIYVMGCRNPWRMTVDSATGYVYWGEVGPDAGGDGPRGPRGYDEINQARQAGNFGWPYFVGNNRAYADVDFATGTIGAFFDPAAPINESPNNTGEKQLPPAQPAMLYYPGGPSSEFPELGSGGRTACAGPVYHYADSPTATTRFPKAYDRALFIYEWTRNWVKVVTLDSDNRVARIEPFLPGYSFVRPIDMAFGPEGSLYVIEYGETWGVNPNARLIRIDYLRGNRPPVAVASVQNNIGRSPLTVSLSSDGSVDKDAGDALSYEWRVVRAAEPAGPGTAPAALPTPRVVSTEANPKVTFDEAGVYNVELVVTDRHGASRAASVPVLVGNERPRIQFAEPQPGDFFEPDQPIRYRLIVQDAEDGTNDDHEIDDNGAQLIDGDSPGRVSLNAVFSKDPPPVEGSGSADQGPAGMRMMKRSDCFNCHAVDQKRVGPMLLEIATKYRGKEGALEASVERVLKGSTGVWGKIPMIPHAQHTPEELREMVGWIYSLEPAGLVRVFSGFTGDVPVGKDEGTQGGHYKLEATYLDRGAGMIPALNASATIFLRPRLVEAETADTINGPQILGSGSAGGGKFIGAINHGHYLRFQGLALDTIRRAVLRVASAGAGGSIEIRIDSPEGPVLATVPVEVNGHWEKWYERTAELPETHGRHDVFVRFIHPSQAGGLMNLDSVQFLR